MGRVPRLSDAEVRRELEGLPHWSLRDGKLHREFVFADFNEAFGFMSRSALVAERMDHHPEWSNVWARVRVDLTTHDAQGISEKDFELARAMNRIAGAPTA